MDQQSLRKAIGALKDSTTVGLAKVNSDYKELDVAIVKATNHVEVLAKEKYIHTIFDAISASKPRADVAYCINALARRLAKTRNWAVAIKTLIIIHRALREVDATFREEFVNFSRTRSYFLNLSHFKDDSSPNAWDYSFWVRTYALYIEERLECFRVLKYDVETEHAKTSELDSVDLLEHLPALQQLLFRLLTCQPEGAAVYNSMIQYALSIVANESTKIYYAINGCTLNLVDKFFEMNRHDALRALEIYRKAGHQAERLSAFYEIYEGLIHGREKKFVKIEQPPASFIAAMEEYVKEAPHFQPACQSVVNADRRLPAPKPIMAIEHKNVYSDDKKPLPSEPSEAEIPKAPVPVQTQVTDLLGLDNFSEATAKLEEHNAQALAIVSNGNQLFFSIKYSLFELNYYFFADIDISLFLPADDSLNSTSTMDLTSGASGWELALVSTPSSNEGAVAESKRAGGLDKLTLDSLYDDAISRRTNPNYHLGLVASNPFEASQYLQDPFHASNNIAPPTNVQMATMAHLRSFTISPSGNPFEPTNASYPTHNPYVGFM